MVIGRVGKARAGEWTGKVFGCGSNVIDVFLRLSSLPIYGGKVLLSEPPTAAKRAAGGVTFNHLAWAAALGVPTSLMARQGRDENGTLLRKEMARYGVGLAGVSVSDSFSTGESYVLVTKNPYGRGVDERTILMYPGSTIESMDTTTMTLWKKHFRLSACMFTTEVSQLPLYIVSELLREAELEGLFTAIDVDRPLEAVCSGSNALGTEEELWTVLHQVDMIKTTHDVAMKLIEGGSGSANELLDASSASIVAVTDGDRGAEFAVRGLKVPLSAPATKVRRRSSGNAVGAGDAFFGGLIANVFANGGSLPESQDELQLMASQAVACGALCCTRLDALPPRDSPMDIFAQKELPDADYHALKLLVDKVMVRKEFIKATDSPPSFPLPNEAARA